MSGTISLDLLGEQMRAMQRQMAMLQAAHAELATRLPTREELQAGFSAIDRQFVELGNIIAEKVTAAIGEHLTAIDARLGAIDHRLDAIEKRLP